MSVRSQVLERCSEELNLSVRSLERITDSLAAIGATPKGKRGGRSGAVHYLANHLVATLLGSSALIPAEAATAYLALHDLEGQAWHYLGAAGQQPEAMPRRKTFAETLIDEVASSAVHLIGWGEAAKADREVSTLWRVQMSPEGREAAIYKKDGKGGLTFCEYRPKIGAENRLNPSAIRTVELRLPVLVMAGELLADSLQHQNSKISDPPAGGERGSDAPKKTKAATGGDPRDLRLLQPTVEPHSRTPSQGAGYVEWGRGTRVFLSSARWRVRFVG